MDRFFVSLTEMIQYITQSVLRSNVFIAVFSVNSTTLSTVIKPDISKKKNIFSLCSQFLWFYRNLQSSIQPYGQFFCFAVF